jgi:hypothetical protein
VYKQFELLLQSQCQNQGVRQGVCAAAVQDLQGQEQGSDLAGGGRSFIWLCAGFGCPARVVLSLGRPEVVAGMEAGMCVLGQHEASSLLFVLLVCLYMLDAARAAAQWLLPYRAVLHLWA